MPPTNLDQFYRQQGQALPSLVDRAKVFEQQGLGQLQTYQGTAEQNSALLNKLIAGTAAPMKPPTGVGVVVSSDQARNQFNQNINALPKLESEFMPKTGQVGDVAIKNGGEVKSGVGGETPLPEPQGAITIKSNNPAFQSIIDQTNEMIRKAKESGLTLPPSAGDLIRQIQDYSLTKAAAVADAREAADAKNAAKLNESLAKVKEAETTQKSAIQTLLEELRTARVGMTEALAPTERETELKRNLQELRTTRQLMPLELRKEGISAGGIQDRQGEDERVRAIQESNLLFELGLEQEARQMKGAAFEKQAGFIKDDINLQMKIEENLKAEEAKIVEQARALRKDSVTALSDIVESFEGLAFTDMDAETQTQLLETAKNFNIPSGLLTSALANAKKQKVFENSLKVQKGTNDGGLTDSQLQGAIDRVTDDSRQDPITKQYTTALPAFNTLGAIKSSTTNPADDIGAIYAFAKIMDPESVVREGEYATIQKYAQSWAESFGFDAARIFSNTKFLTTEALKNMKTTAGTKMNALKSAYQVSQKGYQQRIDDLKAGKIGTTLPDYGSPVFDLGSSLPPANTTEEKEKVVDDLIKNNSSPAKVPDVQEDPPSFFESFLSVFGLRKK